MATGNIKIITPVDKYKRVSLDLIQDNDVDPTTLGIYVKALALGARWNLNIKGLASLLKVSEDKIRKAFGILEDKGFLRRTKAQDARGRFNGWDYEIGAAPLTDIAKTPTSENTDIGENRRRENRPLNINNNIKYEDDKSSSKYISQNIKIEREDAPASPSPSRRFTPPTVDEVREYCRSRHNAVNAEAFVAFYTSNGWKVGKNTMKDWKAAVITWEKRDQTHTTPVFTGYTRPTAR